MQATATLSRSSSTRQGKPAPAVQRCQAHLTVRQLSLFPLQQSIACCWDLICPEEAWEDQPLRWAV